MQLGTTVIDGRTFKKLLIGGGRWLRMHRRLLNDINVFPVPDGDTGTNMSFTMRGALLPLLAKDSPVRVGEAAEAAAKGALIEAHGNSGVILSQILRGFASGLQGKDKASTSDFSRAFSLACSFAYKSVQKPEEGTILTIVRVCAEEAELIESGIGFECLEKFMEAIAARARKALNSHTDEPQAVREAKVADSGALGLFYILEGMMRVTAGQKLILPYSLPELKHQEPHIAAEHLQHRYCCEFLLNGCSLPAEELKIMAVPFGSSIIAAEKGGLIKLHIHTNSPVQVEEFLAGVSISVHKKIEDMLWQCRIHAEKERAKRQQTCLEPPSKKYIQDLNLPTVITECLGSGWCSYFAEGWGFELLQADMPQDLSAEKLILKRLTGKADTQALKNTEILAFARTQERADRLTGYAESLGLNLKAKVLQSPIQLAAALTSADPLSAIISASELNWFSIRKCSGSTAGVNSDLADDNSDLFEGFNKFSILQDGKKLGESQSLREAVLSIVRTESGAPLSRVLLAAGQGISPDEAEAVVSDLLRSVPETAVSFVYGGQPDEQILIYMETKGLCQSK